MRRDRLFRALTLFLAYVHTMPARRHLGEFFERPSWQEGWKGFGALIAIVVYLFPPLQWARAVRALWNRRRNLLRVAGVVLGVVHLVPACDHLPKFVAAPSFADAWRGFGSAFAAVWFLTSVHTQMRLLVRAQVIIARLFPKARERDRPSLAQ